MWVNITSQMTAPHVCHWFCPLQHSVVLYKFWRDLVLFLPLTNWLEHFFMWRQEQLLLTTVNSSSAVEARVKNFSLESLLYFPFLSFRPLLLVLLSSETEEFPSFIYIITLKVFIDRDQGPLSLLSLRLYTFSSHSVSSHILSSNSSITFLALYIFSSILNTLSKFQTPKPNTAFWIVEQCYHPTLHLVPLYIRPRPMLTLYPHMHWLCCMLSFCHWH